jgi:hypothetical protein
MYYACNNVSMDTVCKTYVRIQYTASRALIAKHSDKQAQTHVSLCATFPESWT